MLWLPVKAVQPCIPAQETPVAVIVTASVTARCLKQHTCCACGCVFRYVLERTASASGGPGEDQAYRATRSVTEALLSGTEEHACPGCGVIQPDMAGKSKAFWHTAFTAITGVLLLLIVLPTLTGKIPLDRAGEAAACVAGFALLGHLVVALWNPNWSLAGNRTESEAEMRAGKVSVERPGGPLDPAAVPANLTLAHALCILAILAAPLGFLAARLVSELNPMPRNPALEPDVVGPGDAVQIPIEASMRTYGGYWVATAVVKALNADELGITPTLIGGSKTDKWGRVLHVSDGKAPFEPIKPWAKVTLPDDPNLGGKTLRLRVSLNITYPTDARRGGNHPEASTLVTREVEIHLADAGADRLYKQAWYYGAGLGLAGCVLGGLALAALGRMLRARATPPQTFML